MLDNVPKIKTFKAFIFLHMSQCEVHLHIVAGVFPWSLTCTAEKIKRVLKGLKGACKCVACTCVRSTCARSMCVCTGGFCVNLPERVRKNSLTRGGGGYYDGHFRKTIAGGGAIMTGVNKKIN